MVRVRPFRQSRPDLKEAARMSRQFDHEAHRVAYADNRHPKAATIAAGMELAALLLDSLVCAWPADSLVEVDAKLALADGRGRMVPTRMRTMSRRSLRRPLGGSASCGPRSTSAS